jgi:hypothetical protein
MDRALAPEGSDWSLVPVNDFLEGLPFSTAVHSPSV